MFLGVLYIYRLLCSRLGIGPRLGQSHTRTTPGAAALTSLALRSSDIQPSYPELNFDGSPVHVL